MEILIHLGIVFCRQIDRLAQEPLSQIVPDLDALLTNPGAYFRDRAITIHPRRRWSAAICFGLLFFATGFIISVALLGSVWDPMKPGTILTSLGAVVLLAMPVVTSIAGCW